MATFKPPTEDVVVWADRNERGIFAYLAPGPRGKNVFKLTDGSFTEDQPLDMTTVAVLYHGGHRHPITAAEQADLVEAGYGAYIIVGYGIRSFAAYSSTKDITFALDLNSNRVLKVNETVRVTSSLYPQINGDLTVLFVNTTGRVIRCGWSGEGIDQVFWDGVNYLGEMEVI